MREFAEFLEHLQPLFFSFTNGKFHLGSIDAQLIRPACTMALRTATRVGSDTGTIGSRSFSSILPSSDIAYLIGDGLELDEKIGVQRHQLVMQLEGGGVVALLPCRMEFEAQPRRDV